jgi:TolB protein
MLDGSQLRRLTRSAKNEFDAAWSSDGKRIAFRAAPSGLPPTTPLADVFIINADGSGQRNLTHNLGRGNWDPSWSADGTTIGFGSAGPDVWTIRTDGRHLHPLTRGGGESPAWSPDGKRIAFMSTRTGNQYDIYLMNADGSGIRRLTTSPNEDGWPAWSPDGKTIAYSNGPSLGKWNIWLMSNDGTHKRVLVRFAGDTGAGYPNWSPDGQLVIFSAYSQKTGRGGIYLVDADGSKLTKTKIAVGAVTPVWQPRQDQR